MSSSISVELVSMTNADAWKACAADARVALGIFAAIANLPVKERAIERAPLPAGAAAA